MREKALRNNGGKFPDDYLEPPRKPPSPSAPIDDADILVLSLELNAASLDDVPGDLDETGLERVPMADPGLDVSVHFLSRCDQFLICVEPYPSSRSS